MIGCCSPKTLRFFKSISDKHRQLILNLLKAHKNLNASEIQKHIKLSQPTTSHHLSLLAQSGAIEAKKKGKEVYYSLSNKNISSCCLGFLNDLLH
jgi:DNA-binding transcriptional ArsR family regulator